MEDAVRKKNNRIKTRSSTASDAIADNEESVSNISPQKRKIEEVMESETSGFEQLLTASSIPSLSTAISSSNSISRDQKVDNTISQFYTPEENELLSFFDAIVQAYNIYDMDEFYQLLSIKCHPNTTLRLKNFSYTITGVHPIIIFCNITHECYPDAMLKILEKRIINLTTPVHSSSSVTASVHTRSSKSSSSKGHHSHHHANHETPKELDIKLEYICKFHGTIISNQDIAKICQEFLNSPEIPGNGTSSSTGFEGNKVNSNESSKSSKSNAAADKNRLSKASLLEGMKMDDLSMGLARFVSSHYTPTDSNDQSSHPASFFIIELIFTLDAEKKRILHTEMDILAASEQMTTIQKSEE